MTTNKERVEEPRALIPDVGNGGRACGSSNINLAMENSVSVELKTRKTLKPEKHERERETERHKKIVLYFSIWQQRLSKGYKSQFI